MNWGNKIAIVIVVFVVLMLGMVYVAFRQTNEMIDTNYYEKELNYQAKIDAANNLNKATTDTLITQNQLGVLITIPRNLLVGFAKGKIEFLRNDDKKKDIVLTFTPDSTGVFLMEHSKFTEGMYKARVQWDSESKTYYREQDLMVQQ